MMRRREAVLDTTFGERLSGSGYAAGMAATVNAKKKESAGQTSRGQCDCAKVE